MPVHINNKKTSSLSRILIILFVLFVIGCMIAVGYYSSKPNTINSRASFRTCEIKGCPVGKVCANDGRCRVPTRGAPDKVCKKYGCPVGQVCTKSGDCRNPTRTPTNKIQAL